MFGRLLVKKKKRAKVEQRIQWWKWKKEDRCEDLWERLRQPLAGCEELPDDRVTTATVIREMGREVYGASFVPRTGDKESWWWNREVKAEYSEEQVDEEEMG